MKHIPILLLTVVLSNFTPHLQAQNFSDKVAAAKLILLAAGYDIADTYYGNYAQDQYVYKYKKMYQGVDYAVMIISENGVYDADVYLTRGGSTVKSNTESRDEGATYIEYTPWLTSTYKIEAHNEDSYSYYSYQVAIIVGYQ